jgi:hypothetical protein
MEETEIEWRSQEKSKEVNKKTRSGAIGDQTCTRS